MDFNIKNYISNLSYINKDFNSIWEEILDVVPKLTNKWVPGEANESDPLVVLLKELGIVSDKINYNTDKNVLELFPDLVTQLRTAYSVFKSMGYNPNWYRSATTSGILITYNGGAGDQTAAAILDTENGVGEQSFTLPLFTEVCNEDSTVIYTLLEGVEFKSGRQEQKKVSAIQGTINNFEINGSTKITVNNLDSQNRLYFVQPNVAQNGIFISFEEDFKNYSVELGTGAVVPNSESSDTSVWKRVDNIYQYLPGSYVYKFGIDPSTGSNYIQFPDDIGELIGEGIYIKYILSDGANGNINAGAITELVEDPSIAIDSVTITRANFSIINSVATHNGADPESIEEMQRNYERVVGTFNTLVTLRDYDNYIYNATNQIGRNVVSNIKVSDRNNDLYTHVDYKTMDIAGNILNESTQVAGDNNLTAFNLRLYPLPPVENINSLDDYNKTFDCIQKVGKSYQSYQSTAPWVKNITDSIESVKSINHDFMADCGVPIFVDCTVEGQVYLQKAVSASEATEIKNNIDLAIYRNFNARQLYFGEKINYTKLVDVVKNADPRIQYVAINPINYYINENATDSGINIFNSKNNNNLDITKRSILNGSTPFLRIGGSADNYDTGLEPFPISWGKKNSQLSLYENITSITPLVTGFVTSEGTKVTTLSSGNAAIVQAHETLSIIVPEYVTTTSYGNYLYAITTQDLAEKLKNGAPYKLEEGEKIEIVDAKVGGQLIKTCTESTVLKFESSASGIDSLKDLGAVTGTEVQDFTYSLGAKNTISIIEKDETVLENSYAKLNSGVSPDVYGIKIASNSKNLFNYLCGLDSDSADYTLNIGEYLLYADARQDDINSAVLEVGIVGEGNTIINVSGSPVLKEADEEKFIINSSGNIEDNITQQGFAFIPSGKLKYRINTIYSFGEDTSLTFNKEIEVDTFTKVVDLKGVTTITYKTDYKTESTSETLPGIQGDDTYKLSYALSLQIGPELEQELQSNQEVELKRPTKDEGGEEKEESVKIPSEDAPGKCLRSSAALLYPGGGNPLQLSESDTAILKLLVADDSYYSSSTNYFNNYAEETDTTDPFYKGRYYAPSYEKTTEKKDTSLYIYAYLGESNTIEYAIIRGGATILENLRSKARGPLYLIKKDANYYNKTWNNLSNALAGKDFTGPLEVAGSPALFLSNFCPLSFPDDDVVIMDPMAPDSFFKSNHPCNAYVLPRLRARDGGNPLKGLTISQLSTRG